MRAALEARPLRAARNPNRSASLAFSREVFFKKEANCPKSRRYEESVFFDSPSSSHNASQNASSAAAPKLAAYVAAPAGKPRGGVIVIPEIFGVNSHIQQVTDGFAADGYLAVAPAMFDRARRNYDTGYSQPEIEAGVAIMQKLDPKQSMMDVQAAVAEAKKGGKVGIVGYCYGGTVAWMAAARASSLA